MTTNGIQNVARIIIGLAGKVAAISLFSTYPISVEHRSSLVQA